MSTTIAGDQGFITVSVAAIPGPIRQFAVPNGATVADVARVAELDASRGDFRVGGQPVTLDQPVAAGAFVARLERTRGN